MKWGPARSWAASRGWAGLGSAGMPRLLSGWVGRGTLGGRVLDAASSRARAERGVHAPGGRCEPAVPPPPPRSRPATELPNFPQLAPGGEARLDLAF